MKREYLYYIFIIVLVILIGFAIFGNNKQENIISNNKTTTNDVKNVYSNIINNNTINSKKVEIIKDEYDNKWGIINVYIKNNTSKDINKVVVKATCKDKDGINLGTRSGGQYNINTKDTYKIKIICPSDTAKYNLSLSYE